MKKQPKSLVHPLSARQHEKVCEVIDRAKMDDTSLDTDEYAAMIEKAVRPRFLSRGTFDRYREQWRRVTAGSLLNDATDGTLYGLAVRGHGQTHWLDVTPAQAEFVMKYLSESNPS